MTSSAQLPSTSSASASSSSRTLLDAAIGVGMDDDTAVTAWMQPMERSWEEIVEDETTGGIKTLQIHKQRERKKKLDESIRLSGGGVGRVIEKSVIRYLYIIVDFSWSINQNDIKPTRRDAVVSGLELFIRDYFDQNPLSHLGLIVSCNSLSYKLTALSGNPEHQIRALREFSEGETIGGEFSLQNSLELAKASLASIPPYGSREILVLLSAITTVDPGDIHQTINACKASHITCSTIALAAEMYVATLLATTTGGSHSVCLNRDHFRSLLLSHLPPLPSSTAFQRRSSIHRKWMHMGFPSARYDSFPSLCACHMKLRYGGFTCPKCRTSLCELPSECKICGLTLVASPQIARTYHHLQPVQPFEEVIINDDSGSQPTTLDGSQPTADSCLSCRRLLHRADDLHLRCPSCHSIFCIECDEYIHTKLHNCPGCLAGPGVGKHSTSTSVNRQKTEKPQQAPTAAGPEWEAQRDQNDRGDIAK